MKGGMLYFGVTTVIALVVVGVAMYVSGGFQMLQEDYGLAGVIGFMLLFTLIAVGFMAYVRVSLKRSLGQGGAKDASTPKDETDVNWD